MIYTDRRRYTHRKVTPDTVEESSPETLEHTSFNDEIEDDLREIGYIERAASWYSELTFLDHSTIDMFDTATERTFSCGASVMASYGYQYTYSTTHASHSLA